MAFLRFFFGTPRRFLATFISLIVAVVGLAAFTQVYPGLIQQSLENVVMELAPFIITMAIVVLKLAIMWIAIRWMYRKATTPAPRERRRDRG